MMQLELSNSGMINSKSRISNFFCPFWPNSVTCKNKWDIYVQCRMRYSLGGHIRVLHNSTKLVTTTVVDQMETHITLNKMLKWASFTQGQMGHMYNSTTPGFKLSISLSINIKLLKFSMYAHCHRRGSKKKKL